MSEDRTSSGGVPRSWLERLTHVLSGGEPRDKSELLGLLRLGWG